MQKNNNGQLKELLGNAGIEAKARGVQQLVKCNSPQLLQHAYKRIASNARGTEEKREDFGLLDNFHLGARLHNAAKRMCDQLKKDVL